MTHSWPITLPYPQGDKLVCPACIGLTRRCDFCDGEGFVWAEDVPDRTLEPHIEWSRP